MAAISEFGYKKAKLTETKAAQEAYEKQFSNMVLILDPGSLFMKEHVALTPFVITPTKHYGYALQWFTMSLVLAGMFIYAIKRES